MRPLTAYAALAVVSGFSSGFLARGEYAAAREVPVKVSEVAVEHPADPEDAPKAAAGHAPGSALLTLDDGKTVSEPLGVITPLYARDPAAMVMGGGLGSAALGGAACPPDPPCVCAEDDLHRYRRPAPKRKDLDGK